MVEWCEQRLREELEAQLLEKIKKQQRAEVCRELEKVFHSLLVEA